MSWRLARALRAEGGLLADHVVVDLDPPEVDHAPAAADAPADARPVEPVGDRHQDPFVDHGQLRPSAAADAPPAPVPADASAPADALSRGTPPADTAYAHPDGPARLAASGPRVAAAAAEYELLLEMVVEGTLLHYATGRVVEPSDPDLALLLGDRLYALGLGRLAALGDLEAIAVLADVIASLAQAHAEGDPDRAGPIWEMGARAIGWGRAS